MKHYDAKVPHFRNWETPPDFFKKLDEEFHFTLDAAASHENALCDAYCTPEGAFLKGLPTIDGHKEYGVQPIAWSRVFDSDGLKLSWYNRRIFCNPPYDASLPQWVDKAFKFEAEVAVLLLPPSFDTVWGQKLWVAYQVALCTQGPILKSGVEIRLPPGRLRFYRPAFAAGFNNLGMYGEIDPLTQTAYGERIFDYSKPHVPGGAPRAGNLVAIFRR